MKGNNRPSPVSSRLSPPPKTGTVLAFDFGEKRIGVAVGDLAVGIAHPLTTVSAEDNRTRFAAIAALIEEWRPVELVVGVPAHADGAEHELGRLARRFAQRLEGRFRLTTRLIDERLTSRAAESGLRQQGVRGEKLKATLDAAAAREILQAYFETARAEAGRGKMW
ncbi:MAG: Holliday junction resolvase RuvX [Betaproteobacteria bacterium]|nr:Holliday junction resolvase RuvX [Betaproteobacteria bacterium]